MNTLEILMILFFFIILFIISIEFLRKIGANYLIISPKNIEYKHVSSKSYYQNRGYCNKR